MANPLEPAEPLSPTKRALLAVQQMKAQVEALEHEKHEPIAVVGLGCRFPGANNPDEFWTLLHDGVDAIAEVPPERWSVDAYYAPDPDVPGKMSTRYGGFVYQTDQFDPLFFNISPRETVSLDPQHRLVLEVAWEALEHAALPPHKRSKRAGVFIGISDRDYFELALQQGPDEIDNYLILGNDPSTASGRLSYFLGLTGPSLSVSTACSSSLIAVHLACQSLRNRECDFAFAGGVNLILTPTLYINLSKARMLSPEGRCKAFDAAANGYVRAEGCGLVILKRLSDAQADGDNIQAVIRGTAANQDGRTSSLTVPHGPSQQDVIRQALANARIEPEQVGYIEAHGTGTRLGDPIEIGALGSVFRQREQPLMVGSVKTNIGHSESAAGIAGLIKTILSLKHGKLPPSLHFQEPNPHIDWDDLPINIPTELMAWPAGRRVAGVSSFGFSGTNCHVILEEAPAPAAISNPTERDHHLLTLSAKSPVALQQLAQRYLDHLDAHPQLDLADVCFTANTGRQPFNHRLALVAASTDQLRLHLQATDAVREVHPGPKPIAFLFTGQGAQYPGMGQDLYQSEPVFRDAIEHCEELLQGHLDVALRDVLYPPPGADPDLIHQTAYTQPALFAVEYALAQLWRSWGIEPEVVMGHSVGEYVAACVTGVFSVQAGLSLVAQRGRLMQALPAGGEMVSVMASEGEVLEVLAPYVAWVSMAAINGPRSVVVSGVGEVLGEVCAALEGRGIKTTKLTVSHAFHSPLMAPMLDPFRQVASSVTYSEPQISLISNLTGEPVTAAVTTADYWVRHVHQPVRFAEGIAALVEQGCELFVEIGPKPILLGMGRRCVPGDLGVWLPSLREGQPDGQQILTSLGELYGCGVDIDWSGFNQDHLRRKVVLPTYPFERQRYWIDVPQAKRANSSLRPLIDTQIKLPLHHETVFETAFSTAALPFLADHRVYDTVVSPGACQLAMALSGAELAFGTSSCQLEDVVFPEALVVPEKETCTVQLVFTQKSAAHTSAGTHFQLISFDADGADAHPATHATGRVAACAASAPKPVSLETLRQRCGAAVALETVYQIADREQIAYGPCFRWLADIWRGDGEWFAKLRRPDAVGTLAGYVMHPGVLEACFQLTALASSHVETNKTLLPFAVQSLRVYQPASGGEWWCHARRVDQHKSDIQLLDPDGHVMAEVVGFEVRAATPETVHAVEPWRQWLYQRQWQTQALAGHKLSSQPRLWVLFADAAGIGEALAGALRQQGEQPILVAFDTAFQQIDATTFRLNPEAASDYQRLFGHLSSDVYGIVHLWSLNEQPIRTVTDLEIASKQSCGSVLQLIQALLRRQATAPRLWLVTRGAMAVSHDDAVPGVAQSMLWGMGRVIAQEHPEFHCVRVDIDAQGQGDAQAKALCAEITTSALPDTPLEDQVAFRDGRRYVARLQRYQQADSVVPDEPYRLDIAERGTLEQLRLQPLVRREPGAGEIEIRVHATGLNFRDVLNALGLYPGDPGPLGDECAGEVVAIGSGVDGVAVGDRVIALVYGGFSQYVTTPADWSAPIPVGLRFEEAATIPIAFLTATYCLQHVVRIQPGDRVLVHSAAGGVGMAAVQVVQAAGGEVFGTASPDKWDALKALGVQHLYPSRTLDFADAILADTQGRGVDVVLNSLTGEGFVERSLNTLAANGHFIEISKRAVWDARQMAAMRPDISYALVDLADVAYQQPGLIQAMLQDIRKQVEKGTLTPLRHTAFPLHDVVDAFRCMQQAKHIGKIVVTSPTPAAVTIRGEATYLITGGLGGLGLLVARWLAEQGARHLVLMGRRPPQPDAQRQLGEIEALGTQVTVAQADVANARQVAEVLGAVDHAHPLRGVIHAAGVLDDGALLQQTWDRFATVLAPKVSGTWNLHTLTQDLALDFFTLFSSSSGLLGNPGQANYAAANVFQNAFAHYRQVQGLPAMSIDWDAWSTVGMAAELVRLQRAQLEAQGLGILSPQQGLQAFANLLHCDAAQIGVLLTQWQPYLSAYAERSPFFEAFTAAAATTVSPIADVASPTSFRQRLETIPTNERRAFFIAYLQDQITTVSGLSQPSPQLGFAQMGMDSLMTIELRNRLQTSLQISLPATLAFEYPTIEALSAYLLNAVFTPENAVERQHTAQQPDDRREPVTRDDANQRDALVEQELAELEALLKKD